jgi:hypothetical protein
VTIEYFGNLSKSRSTPQNLPSSARTNGNGHFSLKLLDGMSYLLRAVNTTNDITAIRCAAKTIVPKKNMTDVRLVLSKMDSNYQCFAQ